MLGFLSMGPLKAATLGEIQSMGGKRTRTGQTSAAALCFYLQVKVARKGNMFLFFV